DRLAGEPVRDEVAHPDGDEDRHATHRRRAALGLVALRALVADLLPEALAGEEPDQVRGEQDGDRERHARGDEDSPHATGSRPRSSDSAIAAAASRSSPAAREALTSTTSPGSSSARSRPRAAATSAT